MRQIKITPISLTLLLIILLFSPLSARETISIAVHDYPPFYNNEAKGMMTDIYKAAFNRVGIKATTQTFPIKRGILYLFNNQVDAFSPGHILFNAEQKEKALWENAFIVEMVMIYHKPNFKKTFKYNSMEDLRGYKLASLVNSPYIELYKKHGLIIFPAQTPQQMIRIVRAGHADFFVNTLLSGLSTIHREYPEEGKDFDYFSWAKLPCSFAVSKENPNAEKWLALFRQGLSQIKKDGTYIRIFETYWGKGNIPKGVLFDDLTSFGVDHVDAEAFHKPPRTPWGQIDLSLNSRSFTAPLESQELHHLPEVDLPEMKPAQP